MALQTLTPKTPIGFRFISGVSFSKVPLIAAFCHISGTAVPCIKREAGSTPDKYNQYKKGVRKMEWIERLNKTIIYIEEHLTEEISYEQFFSKMPVKMKK